MDNTWNGATLSRNFDEERKRIYRRLADAAKSYDWPTVMTVLNTNPELINATRLDGASLYAPLHQAAYGGAAVECVEQLLKFGAWRTLPNARGEKALDIAQARGHRHLISALRPVYKRSVPLAVLRDIQRNFHTVINGRVRDLVEEQRLRLPELEPLLELDDPKMWFAVPGMYGGFSYWLENEGDEAKLFTESWCRVVGGSGQRHEISSAGSDLVAEGFV